MCSAKASFRFGWVCVTVCAMPALSGCTTSTGADLVPSSVDSQRAIRDAEDLHRNLGREVVLEGDVPRGRKGFPELVLDSGVTVDLRTAEGVRETDLYGHVTVRGVVEDRNASTPPGAQGGRASDFRVQSDYRPPRDSQGRPFLILRVTRILERR